MYNVGDKIFYPLHGAGIINSIEEKNILNEVSKYYIIEMPGGVTVMLPVDKSEELGLRSIISKEKAESIINNFTEINPEQTDKWSTRFQENKDKMKTGDVDQITDIYKNLTLRNKVKNLSTSEKKMLMNAKQSLISELSFALNKSSDELEKLLDDKLLTFYNDNLANKND